MTAGRIATVARGRMRSTRGFTLIELMTLVMIIAIIATMTMPIYQDHMVRSQAAVALTQGAKVGVTERFSNQGAFPAGNVDAGLALPGSISGRYAQSMTLGNGNGEIAVLFGGDANAAINGQKMVLQATDISGSLDWQCSSPGIDPRYLPNSCR